MENKIRAIIESIDNRLTLGDRRTHLIIKQIYALLRSVPEWISFDDALPKEGVEVFVWGTWDVPYDTTYQDDTTYQVLIGLLSLEENVSVIRCAYDNDRIEATHWAPLPQAPTNKEEKDV